MGPIDDSFFRQASVAIAGASADYNIGHAFVQCLQDSGFKGPIYPLNPAGGEIRGLPVYRGIAEVPHSVDYVISCIPAPLTPQLVRDSIRKGARLISFFTAGYSETGGPEGRELENRILEASTGSRTRLLGPNCLGIYCPESGLSFSADFPRGKGRVAFMAQSGGNAIYLIRSAARRGVRFSKAVSYGNACDINECDLMEYFLTDPETGIVAAYVEGVKDGPRFARLLRRLAAAKPMIILKGGRTPAGSAAASSHTGSLAAAVESWGSLLDQSGAIAVDNLDEMADMLVAFSAHSQPSGDRAGILGSNGGFSVLSADEFIRSGFRLTQMTPSEQHLIHDQVARHCRTSAGMILHNPYDVTNIASSDGQYAVQTTLARSRSFDFLAAQISISNSGWPFANSPYTAWPHLFLDTLIRVHRETGKPMAVILHSITDAGELGRATDLRLKCEEAGLPVYDSIPRAALATARLVKYRRRTVSRRPRP